MNVREGVHLPTLDELRSCPLIDPGRMRRRLVGTSPEDTRRLWLEARRGAIGASDVPAIMGTSPSKYNSAYALWCDKAGLLPIDEEILQHQMFGNLMEEPITKAFGMIHSNIGVMVDPEGMGIAHATMPYNIASVDRFLFLDQTDTFGTDLSLNRYWIPTEIKNVSEYKRDGWGTSYIPEDYYDQVQDQLEVTGRPCSLLLALIGGNRLKVYTVWRDILHGETIVREIQAFWESLQRGEMPPPDDSEATTEAIIAMHGRTDGTEMAPTEEIVKWATAMIEATEHIDGWEAKKVLAANTLRHILGDTQKVKHPLFSINFGNQTRQVVDKAAAEADEALQAALRTVETLKGNHKGPVTIRVLKVTPSKARN